MRDHNRLGTLIVTGASRGIGAATASLAATLGYAVAVNFNSGADGADKVVGQIRAEGGQALAVKADISTEDEVVRMFATARNELGPVTGLVNNAAITGGFARVEQVTSQVIMRVLAVNVAGAMLCAREAG
jgi:NAD(P)-dependent dehydrogenase (short-subunit alcohol dehydrogenase family)